VELGLMRSPVLMVNDKPVLIGSVPNQEELKKIISKNIQ
jgi:hypothetical protein